MTKPNIEFKYGEVYFDGELVARYKWAEDREHTIIDFINPYARGQVKGKEEAERMVRARMCAQGKGLTPKVKVEPPSLFEQ